MKWLLDILKEFPLSDIQRARLEQLKEDYARLEAETEKLRDQIDGLEREKAELVAKLPAKAADDLVDDDKRVLVYLYHCRGPRQGRPFEQVVADNELGHIARELGLDRGAAQYRVERLQERGLAQHPGGDVYGNSFWSLTKEGRAYVVENGVGG